MAYSTPIQQDIFNLQVRFLNVINSTNFTIKK